MGVRLGIGIGVGRNRRSPYWTNLITVGVGKDYATITEAIAAAHNGNQILIDAGNYNEVLDLTGKRLKLIGSGNLGTLVYFIDVNSNSTSPTVDIAKNCAFENIVFDRRVIGGQYPPPIVNISACNPIFKNCKIGQSTYIDGYEHQNPMTIQNGSIVTMTGCEIAQNKIEYPNARDLIVKDTSKLYFEGEKFCAHLWAQDTAEVHIITDYLYECGNPLTAIGILADDDSHVYVNVRVEEIAYNANSVGAYELLADGVFGSGFLVTGHGYMEVTGNLNSSSATSGGGGELYFKDVTVTEGNFWYITKIEDEDGDVVTYDNCQVFFDMDDDVHGSHILEAVSRATVNVINGSKLEFSGWSGKWHTYGSVGGSIGRFFMRDSEVIDNCNDNFPARPNYGETLTLGAEVDIQDSIITNKNWDHVLNSENANIDFKKRSGQHINFKLKNVVFNNDCDATPINLSLINCTPNYIEGDDWIAVENLTNNTTKPIFMVDSGVASGRTYKQDILVWGQLRSQYPDKIVDLGALVAPTLANITNGVRVSWIDNTKDTEIWGYNGTATPAMVGFVEKGASYFDDDALSPVAMRHYYIRQVDGIHYSDYSAVANIALTEIEKIDQVRWCEVGLAYWLTHSDFVGNGSSVTGTKNLVLNIPGSTGKRYRIAITRTATLEIWWGNFLGYISDGTPTRDVTPDGDAININQGGAVTITAMSIKEIIP